MAWLVSCALKAALLLAASWLGAALLRRGAAAARHHLWTLGVVGALAMPVLAWALPSLSVATETTTIAGTSLLAPAVHVTAGPGTGAAPSWPVWLAIAWAAGTIVVSLRLVRGHLAARRLARTATPDVPASWSAALAAAAPPRRVALLRSDAVGSPMTMGVLRPRVILPTAAEAWTPDRLRAVLVHELGHVRRHDTVIQLAAQLGCALYWWNPLAWLAAARLRVEREQACDDLVLHAGILPSSYAADLLEVARSISAAPHAGAIGMVDRSSTEARLVRILDASTPRRPLRARFRWTARALLLAAAVTLACTASPPVPGMAATGVLSVGTPFLTGTGSLRPLDLPSQGPLDLERVSAEVTRRLGNLERCYQRRLAVDPALAGTVVIHWYIDPTGEVMDQCITSDTVHDPEIAACVNALVAEGRFPAPADGPMDVTFPFVFAPKPD